MKSLPQRHQKSVVPQRRIPAGKFKPKPTSGRQASSGVLKPQQLPTMMTARNGAIGEM